VDARRSGKMDRQLQCKHKLQKVLPKRGDVAAVEEQRVIDDTLEVIKDPSSIAIRGKRSSRGVTGGFDILYVSFTSCWENQIV
jgi:hypothetical protein